MLPAGAAAQSCVRVVGPSCSVVRPATGVASNFAAKRSSAITPQKLAVVVSQAPPRWRASVPFSSTGSSACQAGTSMAASNRRAALASGPSISHHQSSSASVVNFNVVPPATRRLRISRCSSSSRSLRCGSASLRR